VGGLPRDCLGDEALRFLEAAFLCRDQAQIMEQQGIRRIQAQGFPIGAFGTDKVTSPMQIHALRGECPGALPPNGMFCRRTLLLAIHAAVFAFTPASRRLVARATPCRRPWSASSLLLPIFCGLAAAC